MPPHSKGTMTMAEASLDCGGSRSEAETAEGNRSATPLFAVAQHMRC